MMLEFEAEPRPVTTPKLYYRGKSSDTLNWIAEGTDGSLYLVPAEAGGWLRRDSYHGDPEELAPLTPHKARTIAWFIYGDIGCVTIAES